MADKWVRPNPDITPPTFRPGDPKLGDTVESQNFRFRRIVAKLKRLRHDNADMIELNDLWVAIDRLES